MRHDPPAIYDEVTLDHHRRPRNFRALEAATRSEARNRLCGDRVEVFVRVADGVVADAGFQGTGCAIMTASASLMTERVKGHSIGEVATIAEALRAWLRSAPGEAPPDAAALGALTALGGVRAFPLRVRCAMLPWDALMAGIGGTR
jgi:nitrogen fixation NifU-like protein